MREWRFCTSVYAAKNVVVQFAHSLDEYSQDSKTVAITKAFLVRMVLSLSLDCHATLEGKIIDTRRNDLHIYDGKSDSAVPDILVKTKRGESCYIDAKHCPAQCGQFVLLPNIETRSFEYCRQNIN